MNTELHFSSVKQDWTTPDEIYIPLHEEFGFTLDPSSTDENSKCVIHYTEAEDGLSKSWSGHRVFCNPPYNNVAKWVKKAHEESQDPNTTVVMLIPAKTDTRHFHEYIYNKAEVRFIKGRIKFSGHKWSAPFPSMIVIFKSV